MFLFPKCKEYGREDRLQKNVVVGFTEQVCLKSASSKYGQLGKYVYTSFDADHVGDCELSR